jgi:hypothetical protein
MLSLVAACGGGSDIPTSDVAGTPRWPDNESLTYAVKSDAGRDLGQMVLGVSVQGSSTTLTQQFDGPTTKDHTTVVVDSHSLKPQTSLREIETPRDKERIEVTYTDEGAVIKHGEEKQSGLSVPKHAYDNDTSLFLWRTLPFAEGYEGRYVTVITNRRSRQDVSLRVAGKEALNVPAGSFDAWHLQIKAGGVTQSAWYADTPARPLVRYDNDNGLIYELARLP